MKVSKFIKILDTVILFPILIFIIALSLISCTPQDLKYDDAIEIAKKDFGCEKILWIGYSLLLSKDRPEKELRSNYLFYVVGEKDGQEIYIVIPSPPELEEPYITTWSLDHTFAQVVDKFNENGAHYVADVPDDYYSRLGSYIELVIDPNRVKGEAEYYEVGCDGETFYERLDVKVVFGYRWIEDGIDHNCIVTQENGELKSYKKEVLL